jgi:hypothetical protein
VTGPQVPYRFNGRPAAPAKTPGKPLSAQERADAILYAKPQVSEVARHPDVDVRVALALHEEAPAELVIALLTDSDPNVRAAAVRQTAVLDGPQAARAAADPYGVVRRLVAGRDSTPAHLLRKLLCDPVPQVAVVAAANPAVDVADLGCVPLAWVPDPRLAELAPTEAALKLLRALHATSGQTVLVRDARHAVEAALGFPPAAD